MYNGNEKLVFGENELPFTMLDFWQWGYSNLLDNTLRGVFAEFVVKSALALNGNDTNQGERWWHPYDLTGPGGLRLEVKCSAYIQNREQADGLSKISFTIAPTRLFNEYADYSVEAARHSDVFIFCVWTAEQRNIPIFDMSYWDFYVVPTKVIDEMKGDNKTLSFQGLMQLNPAKCDFYTLRKTIMVEYSRRGPYTYKKTALPNDTLPEEL